MFDTAEFLSIVAALGGLLIGVATLAWQIYRDCKKDAQGSAAPEVTSRHLRLELNVDGGISQQQEDKTIIVVIIV